MISTASFWAQAVSPISLGGSSSVCVRIQRWDDTTDDSEQEALYYLTIGLGVSLKVVKFPQGMKRTLGVIHRYSSCACMYGLQNQSITFEGFNLNFALVLLSAILKWRTLPLLVCRSKEELSLEAP